ncbi:MAG: UDP-galactopyranose mutase [Ignavibacteria bacterium]|nr:MAG: UDP-galactopyranose mutase [Ignavibacteria bacterium]KAF0160632.1 MAG: UDP-galactopyranose mutase [Ignavibacteria bacterium]
MKYDYLIVGAGFAGAVMAERIASQLNKKVLIVEKRNHIGGNAYDEYDEHGILLHKYGPHIFHTNSKEVFDYLSQFTEWRFYEHKVLAKLENELYPIPINRTTVNKLYGLNLKTDEETQKYFDSVKEKRFPISNSEDIIVNQIGYDLFEKFFKHYTIKQWNLEPKELSPAVCGRIPVRTNDDCRYFSDKYQLMPKDGYTKMFEKMLSNSNIEVLLNTDYKSIGNNIKFDKMIYTGPIDYFFDYKYGKLPYRSIRFEWETHETEIYQEVAQINHLNFEVSFTRVVEHKTLSGIENKFTTISKEYSLTEGEHYYPILTEDNRKLFLKYQIESEKNSKVVFCGRLAEYQYYNMDQVVVNTLNKFRDEIANIQVDSFKVAAVVVTYNRQALLSECINALRNQTRRLDEIFVINNSSSDGTEEWLNAQADLTVITQPNTGSAGGQHTGIKSAYEKGYDWVWCMDDDVVVYDICLEVLLNFIRTKRETKIAAIQSLKIVNEIETWHGAEFVNVDKMRIIRVADRAVKEGFVETNSFCFEGILIAREIVQKIGLPNISFFINNDDLEYALRIKSQLKDHSIILLGNVLMRRKRKTKSELKKYDCLSKCKQVSDWDIFMMEKYFKNFFIAVKLNYPSKFSYLNAFRFLFSHYRWIFKVVLAILFFRTNRYQRLTNLFRQIVSQGVFAG